MREEIAVYPIVVSARDKDNRIFIAKFENNSVGPINPETPIVLAFWL